jgi:tetratricopeptide (TPR) repeat protein
MARAAVNAKQQAAKASAARARSGKRRHSGGGNPNQDLFFVRLRRHQKWVYAVLAVVFGLSFVLVGVGSGANGGLSQLFTGIFSGSGGNSSVSKAQNLIKTDPAKGYQALATAYESNGDNAQAIAALKHYLTIRKTDAATWAALGGLELTQGSQLSSEYSAEAQNAQSADPSAPFQPGGTLGTAIGANTAYQQAAQNASSKATKLYTNATTSLGAAVDAYKKASTLQPHNSDYLRELANAAASSGDSTTAITALHRYLKLNPNSPLRKQIQAEITSLAPSTPSVKSGGG